MSRLNMKEKSSQPQQGDRERCIEAGMDGYISKPVELSNLREVLSLVPRAAKIEKQQTR